MTCFYFYYHKVGKSFVYDGDGFSQHYKAYIYYGEYLREILKNIFINHDFSLPQYSFSFGEGSDILGTLNYYVMGDPITLLCVFVPSRYMYIFYNFAVILRLYLAGFVFSKLCFYLKNTNEIAILSGSIAYSLCFWGLFNAVRHVYFLNPMIYMPLIILGIEKIINNDKPYLFSIAVTISAISNFYYFYNIVILTIIYVAIRLTLLYKKDFRLMFIKVLEIFKYAVIGVLVGGLIFAPIFYMYIQDNRLTIEFGKHLIYPLNYYKKLPSMFLSTSREYWLCMGYASPVLSCLFLSIINWKKNKTLALLNILGLIMILFPIFGQIMNGNSYISNKWCFGLSLVMTYNLVKQWNEIRKNRIILLVLNIILIIGCLVLGLGSNLIIPVVISIIFVVVSSFNYKPCQILLVALIVINVSYTAHNQYSGTQTGYSEFATTFDEDKAVLNTSEAYIIANNIEDEDFYRYAGNNITQNASIIFNTNSIDYYWSLSNGNISTYRSSLGIGEYLLQKYLDYDQRSTLYTLANVKYYVTNNNYDGILPYGFSFYKNINDYDVYINNNNLPFGYTYREAISIERWNSLSFQAKEEAMCKYLVLNNSVDTNIELNTKNIDYSIIDSNGVEINDNNFKVNETGSFITIQFESIADSETYINIKGLSYSDNKNWLNDPETSTIIYFNIGNNSKYLETFTNDSRYYNGRKNFTINLGYSKEGQNKVTIIFGKKGTYSFDSIELSNLIMDEYSTNINALKQETLQDVVFDTNKVSGNITLSQDKYLLLSIPYSKGWKAYVDGQETELLNGNVAYCALELDKGYHDIELRYSTPLLKEGAILSLVGIALLVIDIKKNVKQIKK